MDPRVTVLPVPDPATGGAHALSVRRSRWIIPLALLLIAVVVAVGYAVVRDHGTSPGGRLSSQIRTIPLARLPGAPGDPVALKDALPEQQPAPDAARAINAAVPFTLSKGPAALPYRFVGSALDRDRARHCLAAAALYEAGGRDAEGQKAVMQVVLNRVRHPAFVSSICGTVFQGQERRTGCQFTFTCDGAMARSYAPDRWRDALARADAALNGAVFAPVRLATHYHTDWVHPYWSSSLDKLHRVGTHLFFRWRGYWGTRGAFNLRSSGVEPVIAKLATFAAHDENGGRPLLPVDAAVGDVAASLVTLVALPPRTPIDPARFGLSSAAMDGAQVLTLHPDGGGFLIAVPAAMSKARFAALAADLCGMESVCRVQAWRDAVQVPRSYPLAPPSRQSMAFEFFRDLSSGNRYILGG